jgi:predicted O-methyltransferase YrrM
MNKIITLVATLFLTQSIPCAGEAPSITLDQYLRQMGAVVTEGHICSENSGKVEFFTKLLQSSPSIANIGEIGFNAGHSSDIFLSATPKIKVVSFDIVSHTYARIGKQYIDSKYPGRHLLIEGNSLISVPDFSKKNPRVCFDLIFIDGGHDFNTAYSDIINMRKLASLNTIVVVDDINYPDVAAAWEKCVREGYAKEIQRFEGKNRIWAMGKYMFPEVL